MRFAGALLNCVRHAELAEALSMNEGTKYPSTAKQNHGQWTIDHGQKTS